MEGFRVLEIKKSVFENNDREADKLRQELKKEKTFLLNLMSSPRFGQDYHAQGNYRGLEGRNAHRRYGSGYRLRC